MARLDGERVAGGASHQVSIEPGGNGPHERSAAFSHAEAISIGYRQPILVCFSKTTRRFK